MGVVPSGCVVVGAVDVMGVGTGEELVAIRGMGVAILGAEAELVAIESFDEAMEAWMSVDGRDWVFGDGEDVIAGATRGAVPSDGLGSQIPGASPSTKLAKPSGERSGSEGPAGRVPT